MINSWLNEENSRDYIKFKVINLVENKIEYTDLKIFLATQVLIHLKDPLRLKSLMQKMTDDQFKNYVLTNLIPDKGVRFSPRQSTWTEVLAAEILEKVRGTIIPIYRLRYKEKKNQAMRGNPDVVTCKEEDEPTIFFVEVKSSINTNDDIAKEAYNSLKKINVDSPEIIEHISDKLFLDDKFDVAHIFDKAILEPSSYKRNFQIFLIFEKDKWENEILKELSSIKMSLPNLLVNVVLIESMKQLIEDTYELLPEIAKEVCTNA